MISSVEQDIWSYGEKPQNTQLASGAVGSVPTESKRPQLPTKQIFNYCLFLLLLVFLLQVVQCLLLISIPFFPFLIAMDQSEKFIKLYISECMQSVHTLPAESIVTDFQSR